MAEWTKAAVVNLATFSLAIFVLPLLVFLACSSGVADPIFVALVGRLSDHTRLVLSGALAVVVVNLLVVGFVVAAWKEEQLLQAQKKTD